MDRYSSSTALLSADSEENLYESSGYESTDMSDTVSVESYDSQENLTSGHCHDNQDAVVFKSTHALCDSLKLILSMPELCDVTFLVGANQVPVHGVRAILGTRSRMFYQLILKHIRNTEYTNHASPKAKKSSKKTIGVPSLTRLTIPVRKYDPEVFQMLIQFVHCGTATINNSNVAGLLCGASQFDLRDLINACWEYITRSLRAGNGESLLYGARSYSQHKIGRMLLSMIWDAIDRDVSSRLQKVTVGESSL